MCIFYLYAIQLAYIIRIAVARDFALAFVRNPENDLFFLLKNKTSFYTNTSAICQLKSRQNRSSRLVD